MVLNYTDYKSKDCFFINLCFCIGINHYNFQNALTIILKYNWYYTCVYFLF